MSTSSPARRCMKAHFLAAVFSIVPLSFAVAGEATNCADTAKGVMDQTPGQVLSVTSRQGRCVVVFLMHRDGQRPKRVVLDLTNEMGGYHGVKPKRSDIGQIQAVSE